MVSIAHIAAGDPGTRAPNAAAVVCGYSSAATRGADLRGDDTGLREPSGCASLVEPPAVRAPALVGLVGLRRDASFAALGCATTGDSNKPRPTKPAEIGAALLLCTLGAFSPGWVL